MTAQIPDRVIIDGERWAIMEELALGPVRQQLPVDLEPPNTALWRGYAAEWVISGTTLSLSSVVGYTKDDQVSVKLEPPAPATWVTAVFRIASGPVVRSIHAGYESRHKHERTVEVVAGIVTSMEDLAPVHEFGTAGPYGLDERLGGGSFGQVFAGRGTDGLAVAVKIAQYAPPRDPWAVTMLVGPDGHRVPLGTPAILEGNPVGFDTGPVIAAELLEAQADLLSADGGTLLPECYGLWNHEPSGLPAVVMEQLAGDPPSRPDHFVAVLEALADAAERGLMEAHGDLTPGHVFVAGDGRIRMCDPGTTIRGGLRSVTPLCNPFGWHGPAADVVACGWMMRWAASTRDLAWEWIHAVCDREDPPGWAESHRSAAEKLISCLESPAPRPTWIDSAPDTPDPTRGPFAR